MLGDPNALIAPIFGVLGQSARIVQGRTPVRALPDAAKFENGQLNHVTIPFGRRIAPISGYGLPQRQGGCGGLYTGPADTAQRPSTRQDAGLAQR